MRRLERRQSTRRAPAKRSKRRRAGRLALRPLPGIPFNQIRLTCGY
jgi:hypothetical protein